MKWIEVAQFMAFFSFVAGCVHAFAGNLWACFTHWLICLLAAWAAGTPGD